MGKSEDNVKKYVSAFWGDLGKERCSEHEYDRVVKLIERGEKKIGEIKALERGTKILISLFDNPWEELEFTHVNTKDKLFSPDTDRYLLCWAHKVRSIVFKEFAAGPKTHILISLSCQFGCGQWGAVKMVIRQNPKFRFDYFLRSLPIDLIGKQCEQLMRAAEKEFEQLEEKAREEACLPVEVEEGAELPPIQFNSFRDMQRRLL